VKPLAMIAVISRNRCLGRDGGLVFQLPEDMKRFRRITTGHAVIMGRRTHESIGRPLPGRRNIVVSRDPAYRAEGCETAGSLEQAIALAREHDEMPMIIGGGTLYEAALPLATVIYLTEVDRDAEGDTFFPELGGEWREVEAEPGETPDVWFRVLERMG
jgi:dihydrofolate reductase